MFQQLGTCILHGNKQEFTGVVQPFCELIVLIEFCE